MDKEDGASGGVPNGSSSNAPKAANDSVSDELRRLRDEVAALREQQQALRRERADTGSQPQSPAQSGAAETEPPPKPANPRRRKLLIIVAVVVLIAIAIAAPFLWSYFHSYASTDDAEIDGHINPISSRINGTVTAVFVENTYKVERGALLVKIDPRDYQVAVESARANLAEANAALQSSRQDYDVALANIAQAVATNNKAQRDVVRYSKLIAAGVVSRDEYEEEMRVGRVDAAAVDSARANAAAAQKVIAQRQAAVGAAQASLDQAQLNLSYTQIHAPVSGVVGEKTVQVGERVQPGQAMLAIVPLNDIWVTANFKETELRQMHAGQMVTIHVDALNRDYKGYVEGLAGASGELYSVLPPENATGNYVKVVQRFPVRIRFYPGQDPDQRLRPGMSVEPKVWLK